MWWSTHYDAFISYSHKDNEVVRPLVELLCVNEHRVFWDQNLKAGDRWDAAIRSSIERSGIFVLFWCCDTCESEYVAGELAEALRLKKKIVPVKLCAAAMPSPLGEWQWIDLRQRVQHVCTNVDHQHAADGFLLSPRPAAPPASKKWLAPLATAAALLLLSGVFFERRLFRSAPVDLPKPVSAEYLPTPLARPSAEPRVGGHASAVARERPHEGAAAPPQSSNSAILLLTGSVLVAIALFGWIIASRRRRTSRTLRITMDYLRRLQHGS